MEKQNLWIFQRKREGVEDNVPVPDEGLDPIELVPNLTDNLTEDIAQLTLDGYELDEDYVPAKGNIPAPTQIRTNLNEVQFQEWDSKQTCHRKSDGHTEENLKPFKTPEALTRLEFFTLSLPTKYIKETLLPMPSYIIDGNEIIFAEIMSYLGM